jgi:hypothetical protein
MKLKTCMEKWLPDVDLNHDKQIQSLLCYRYTIGQDGTVKLNALKRESRIVELLNGLIVKSGSPIQRFNNSTL